MKWWTNKVPATTESDRAKHEQRKASTITDTDYAEYASTLKQVEDNKQATLAIKEDLDVAANTDANLDTTLELISASSAEELDELARITDDIEPEVRDALVSGSAKDMKKLGGMLNARQKASIRAIQTDESLDPDERQQKLETYLKGTNAFKAGEDRDEKKAEGLSKILATTQVEMDSFKASKAVAQASARHSNVSQLIKNSRAIIAPSVKVEQFRKRFTKAHSGTPGIDTAIKKAVADGTVTKRTAPNLEKLIKDLTIASEAPLSATGSKGASKTNVSRITTAGNLSDQSFTQLNSLGVKMIDSKGAEIQDAAGVQGLPIDQLLQTAHHTLESIKRETATEAPPKPRNRNSFDEDA